MVRGPRTSPLHPTRFQFRHLTHNIISSPWWRFILTQSVLHVQFLGMSWGIVIARVWIRLGPSIVVEVVVVFLPPQTGVAIGGRVGWT